MSDQIPPVSASGTRPQGDWVPAVPVGRIATIGHPLLADVRDWWACEHPTRPATRWTHWQDACQRCRHHMALTLLNQGDAPVEPTEDNPEATFRGRCALIAARFNDEILAAAVEGRRLKGPPR